MTSNTTNVLLVPPRFYGKLVACEYNKDDEIFWLDSNGHVHRFLYMGRLIDEKYEEDPAAIPGQQGQE